MAREGSDRLLLLQPGIPEQSLGGPGALEQVESHFHISDIGRRMAGYLLSNEGKPVRQAPAPLLGWVLPDLTAAVEMEKKAPLGGLVAQCLT